MAPRAWATEIMVFWFLKKNKPVVVENTKDNISSYGYSIPDDATDYYKSLYKDLKYEFVHFFQEVASQLNHQYDDT